MYLSGGFARLGGVDFALRSTDSGLQFEKAGEKLHRNFRACKEISTMNCPRSPEPNFEEVIGLPEEGFYRRKSLQVRQQKRH